MKNYNKFSKEEKRNINAPLTDKSEDIKEQIQKQEEAIQALKNSISVYFVDKCEFVNLREGQSRDSLVLTVLKNGTFIEPVIYNDTTEWTKVTHQNKTGYIMTKYIGVETSTPVE